MFLASVNRLDEAVEEVVRAHELDPLSPIISTAVGRVLHFAGRYDEAVRQFRKTLEINPGFGGAWADMAMTQFVRGDRAGAEEAVEQLRRLSGGENQGSLEAIELYVLRGETDEARRLLEALRSSEKETPLVPLSFIYLALDEIPTALDLLGEALGRRDSNLVYILCEPGFRRLRREPRFLEIVRRMNLTQALG
jgi:tetratricopeptide (TPR) repeat protein